MSVEPQRAGGYQEDQLNMRKGLSHSPNARTLERAMSSGSELSVTGARQAEKGQPLIKTT